jgi:uncharacterized protein (DUF885 family)
MIEFCRRSRHALDPRSLQSFEKRLSWIEKALERIETGITNEQAQEYLTKDEQLSLELYKLQLGDSLKCTKAYQSYLCCVNRIEGPQTDLPLYARYLPVKTHANRCFYRDFLQAIPKQLMEVHELLQHGLKEMRTPPQVSLSGVVEQSREMIEVNTKCIRLTRGTRFDAGVYVLVGDCQGEHWTLCRLFWKPNTFPIFVQKSVLVKDILMDRTIMLTVSNFTQPQA